MVTIKISKLFVGGVLDGLTHDNTLTIDAVFLNEWMRRVGTIIPARPGFGMQAYEITSIEVV